MGKPFQLGCHVKPLRLSQGTGLRLVGFSLSGYLRVRAVEVSAARVAVRGNRVSSIQLGDVGALSVRARGRGELLVRVAPGDVLGGCGGGYGWRARNVHGSMSLVVSWDRRCRTKRTLEFLQFVERASIPLSDCAAFHPPLSARKWHISIRSISVRPSCLLVVGYPHSCVR